MIHLLVRKIVLNFLLKLSYLKFDFTVTLGYFKPASKNPDPIVWGKTVISLCLSFRICMNGYRQTIG